MAFPEAAQRLPASARTRVQVNGNPIREVRSMDPAEARRSFGIPAEGLVVLVVGGSQGSVALNRTLLDAVELMARRELSRPDGVTLLWSTGPRHHADIAAGLAAAGDPSWVRAVPYIHDMEAALAAADLAVSRAGAMATAELLNHGVPAILVPLPTAAADHQTRNAAALAEAGAAVVTPEEGLTGSALWAQVEKLASDETRRADMVAAARGRAHPTAARDIAAQIARLLPRRAA